MNVLYLNLLLPILAALFSKYRLSKYTKFIISILSLSLAITNIILVFSSPQEVYLFNVLGSYQINLASDKITSTYASMISILYFVTNLYSFFFLSSSEDIPNHDLNPKIHFFFMPLSIMASLCIAYSNNLFTLFVFYEALTLSTYFLVIQSFSEHAMKAGRTYIYILLGSSLIFLIFALIYLEGNYSFASNLKFNSDHNIALSMNPKDIIILIICFVFGFSKTAIFPLHQWLPKAMVAPVPVSAILHAVAVVKSGIFSLLKVFVYFFGLENLSNLHSQIPMSLDWITLLACFTILYSGVKACLQQNLKRILAYSTISQLGYMVLFLSLVSNETFQLTFIQILSHSIAKITLFFAVGIIYISTKKSDVDEIQGMFRILPLPCILFILAALSIIGLPPSMGWIIKSMIFQSIKCDSLVNNIAIICLILSSLMSCYYLLKPALKMLAPQLSKEESFKLLHPTENLSLITLFTYSLALILFVFLSNIIKLIDLG